MREKLKNFFGKLKAFFKKYGVDAALALIIFNFPMYALLFIDDPGFVTFATWWIALWWGLGPLTPGWLVTILLAVFIRWLRMGAWEVFLWTKEAMQKLQLQNQLAAYLTAEEINMILAMAKKVSTEAETELSNFKQILRKKRLQMIDDQWTKETKSAERKPAAQKNNVGDDNGERKRSET